ncbi:integrase core domain-containing protein [Kitasatospora sp. KL5]|uniref:integrase core domain-containing protein n=1 Tax=Kitasatospora sp. KL5 TaxID=3425125 RepID=UPI003D6DEE07
MATASRRPPCCGCCGTRACCWRRTTSGNGASSRPAARPRSRPSPPARTRSGSSTSPSSRPPRAGPGGWLAAGTTGRSTSSAGTCRPPRTSTTPSPPSSSPFKRPSGWLAPVWSTWRRATPTARSGRWSRSSPTMEDRSAPSASRRSSPPARSCGTSAPGSAPPGQNGSRERGFGSLKYEKLFLEEIPDALDLVRHAEDYRRDYNTVRPHEALAWNRPHDVHTGAADPLIPNFPEPENLPTA